MSEEQAVENVTAKEKAFKEVAEKNAAITGVGERWKVGSTKGKNPTVVIYKFLDRSMPETLPKTFEQFMEVITDKQDDILDYLIRGRNEFNQEMAQDPLGEYVSDVWSPEVQLTFRTAVRNYARGLEMDIEDAVKIIRPGFEKKFGA